MKSNIASPVFAFAAVITALVPNAFASSVSTDWLESPNQSNMAFDQWQFFYNIDVSSRSGNYDRLDQYVPAGNLEYWRTSTGIPFVAKNVSGGDLTFVGGSLAAGSVYVHPADGPFLGAVGIGYLVSATGHYDLSGSVTRLDIGNVDWYVDINSTSEVIGLTGDFAVGASTAFSLSNVTLNAGDYVYLIIGNAGSNFSDSTGVSFSVTPAGTTTAPDSGQTALLLATACGAIGFAGRRGMNA
jgi:hypothetical protein